MLSRKGILSLSSKYTNFTFLLKLSKCLWKTSKDSKSCFQMQTTSKNLPQKQEESLKLCIAEVLIESMKRFANKGERDATHSQTKHLFVKFASKAKIKRIFICKDDQLHNDFSIQTSDGHIFISNQIAFVI